MVTLQEKNVKFDVEYVDLKNKPAWFVELSPLGKVPTLEVTEDDGEKVVLFESVAINEYLDEVTDGSMMPDTPLARARARAFVEFSNELLSDIPKITSAKDDEALQATLAKANTKLDRLESELGEGPLFSGSAMSLVDAAFLPVLQRFAWIQDLYPEAAIFEGRPKIARWWATLADRPSVHESAVPDLRQRWHKSVGRDRGGYRSVLGSRVTS